MTKYSPAKTGGYARISPNFQNYARCENDLKDNKHHSFHLGQKYAQIFVLGHNLLVARNSWKAVRFSEQIMSADKYPSIFLRQMATIVYLTSRTWRLGAQEPRGWSCRPQTQGSKNIPKACPTRNSATSPAHQTQPQPKHPSHRAKSSVENNNNNRQ